MTVRAVIADDEPLARERVRGFLAAFPQVEVVRECGDGVEASAALRELRPDLVFLDVPMPGLDGFGLLEAAGDDAAPAVIFVTAHDPYALRAFDVHAADSLLKPFTRKRFAQAVERGTRGPRRAGRWRTAGAPARGRASGCTRRNCRRSSTMRAPR